MTSRARVLAAGVVLLSVTASARAGGIASPTCQGCHSGGASPTTSIEVTPATFSPGDTVTVRVTLRGAGAVGGLFLTTNGLGAFSTVSGQGTRLVNGDVVHSAPKPASSGAVTFDARWTAPATRGGVLFEAAALLANGDGRSGGDSGGNGVLSVAFGCAGTTFFRDFDGDGVGAASSGTRADCSLPSGYSAQGGDCDENDASVKPGQAEACNAKDDDCDGQVDEGLAAVTTWPDEDGDGFGAPGGAQASGCGGMKRATNDLDCDDAAATTHPGALETCNQRDDDCDAQVDDGARVRCGVGWCARFGVTCDPADCSPGPPFSERCNALDDDCDGVVDNGQLCGAGFVCARGRCYEDDAAPDAGTEADGGVDPPLKSAGGCQVAPGELCLALLAWAWRRRVSASR
ncbi:MAG: hypothetical protein AMXMBFR34_21480 [Myxococcaceae bacterium]